MHGASLGNSRLLKGKVYRTYVQSVMVYGSDSWAMKADDMQRLERTERMMIRWMCSVRLRDRKANVELLSWLGIESVSDVVRSNRLRWFVNVECKDPDDWVLACTYMVAESVKGVGCGRPLKT